jgi:uncharacterized protein YbbK (DUF523 family)
VKKPVVVVSACLGFEACRWNGTMVPDEFLKSLRPFVEFLPVCPEVGIGLGVPRDPIRLVISKDAVRLVQPSTGRDLTGEMERFAHELLDKTGPIHAVVLKARSPSCALNDADRYGSTATETPVSRGPGLFALALRGRLRGVPAENERRLMDRTTRLRFLSRLSLPIGEVRVR